jgi:hypothetical protein
VPLYASTVVILGYLRRKILGQPPFEDDGANQFVMPDESANPPARKWGRRATDRLEGATSSGIPGDAVAITDKEVRPEWNRRATDHKETSSTAALDSTGSSPRTEAAGVTGEDSTSLQTSDQEKEQI